MDKKYYYKAMSKDMKCGNFQYKIGEIYTIDSEELELCSNKVFHFCERLEDTIAYYYSSTDRHFLIEVLGDVVTGGNISGSNKIRIVREIARDEIEEYIQNKDSLNAKEFLALYTTNIKLLEILSKYKYWGLREYVAQNLNTPIHILEGLSKDESYLVIIEVVRNVNTPIYILEEFAKDKDWTIRRTVASNPNTPAYLLEKLAKDEIEPVREKTQERLNEITQ